MAYKPRGNNLWSLIRRHPILTGLIIALMLFNLTSLVNPEPSNSPPYASEENNIRPVTESEITISQNIEEETPETTGKANPNFPHWDHNNISYSFDPNYPCTPTKKTAEAYQKIPRVRRAFMTLQEATEDLISFHEKENDGDIHVLLLGRQKFCEHSYYYTGSYLQDINELSAAIGSYKK